MTEALYDRAAHPPPPPGTYEAPQPLYNSPPAAQYPPDPRVWAQTPAPEPEGPSRLLPYGDDARTTQFLGVDDLMTQASEEQHEPDAFAHLFRDQQSNGGGRPPAEASGVPVPTAGPAQPPVQDSTPAPVPAPAKGAARRAS